MDQQGGGNCPKGPPLGCQPYGEVSLEGGGACSEGDGGVKATEPSVEECIIACLAVANPHALVLDPHEVFDSALVGIIVAPADHWPRKTRTAVALYDSSKVVLALTRWLGCDLEEAMEYYGHNTAGAWCGEGTPAFSWDVELTSGIGQDEDGRVMLIPVGEIQEKLGLAVQFGDEEYEN
jgi:hypothetical protein